MEMKNMKITIPEMIPETEESMGGWTRVETDVVRVYQKMKRLQSATNKEKWHYRGKLRTSFLINLSDEARSSHWIKLPTNTAEDLIHEHMKKEIKYANCRLIPFFYLKTSTYSISVWPYYERDYTATKENNWGEEE